jgi:putative ABC transport system substrate-binding protein
MFMTDPSDVDLLINKDVANRLGLAFPPDVERLANKTIMNGKLIEK